MVPKIISKIQANRHIILLITVILLGVILRVKDVYLREIWYDEGTSGIIARQDWGSMFTLLVNDVHPFLYYILLKLWCSIFGFGELALRSFSISFGIAALPLIYYLVNVGAKSKPAALLATFLYSINPFFIEYSIEARMYSQFIFFGLLAAIFFVKTSPATESKFSWNHILFGLFLSLGLYTQYLTIFTYPVYGLAVAYYLFRRYNFSFFRRNLKVSIITLAKYFAFPSLAMIPQLAILFFQYTTQPGISWIPPISPASLPQGLYVFLFGMESSALWVGPINGVVIPFIGYNIAPLLTILVTIIAPPSLLFSLTCMKNAERNFSLLIILLFAIPLSLVVLLSATNTVHLFVYRYLTQMGTFFIICIAMTLWKIRNKVVTGITVGCYIILLLLVSFDTHNKGLRYLPDYLEEQGLISQQTLTIDMTFTDPFDFTVARYYLGSQNDDRIHIYDVGAPGYDFEEWPAIGPRFVYYTPEEIRPGTYIVSTGVPQVENIEEIGKLDKLIIYKKLEAANSR